jgi:hypothetical protein
LLRRRHWRKPVKDVITRWLRVHFEQMVDTKYPCPVPMGATMFSMRAIV